MSAKHLSKRTNWQRLASTAGLGKEDIVYSVLKVLLAGDETCQVVKKIIRIYANGRGVKPDCVIVNKDTGKMLLIEVKNQGATGNAHERMCRNYMPGLQNELEARCGFRYPFFTICTNGLANDAHKSQEISKWFDCDELRDRLFLFKNRNAIEELVEYLKKIVKEYLEYEI